MKRLIAILLLLDSCREGRRLMPLNTSIRRKLHFIAFNSIQLLNYTLITSLLLESPLILTLITSSLHLLSIYLLTINQILLEIKAFKHSFESSFKSLNIEKNFLFLRISKHFIIKTYVNENKFTKITVESQLYFVKQLLIWQLI